ncbi:Uncharacterised protein [Mycobacterium tuberculosis]|nr:hypothetical protein X329_04099 [Mycobacterium tuberculosis XTB13-110]KAL56931.1 hypothetical protein X381_04099 [Mycobacterium tuberculosis XTB13-173]KBR72044.1 hypothetical protein X429_04101 [Mycobacterium tuberculosis XTB13-229]KCE05760.1 hypothetical protein P487_00572 [Mycobacterium tuberculosis TKK_04_0006]CFC74971.1 Uncharacterised protein [Mycobacterium tuberculosis]
MPGRFMGRSADTSQSGRKPRSYQVTPAGPSHLVPAILLNANPKRTADAK